MSLRRKDGMPKNDDGEGREDVRQVVEFCRVAFRLGAANVTPWSDGSLGGVEKTGVLSRIVASILSACSSKSSPVAVCFSRKSVCNETQAPSDGSERVQVASSMAVRPSGNVGGLVYVIL
jgi:hypothetical protein